MYVFESQVKDTTNSAQQENIEMSLGHAKAYYGAESSL
jgi:hypothetical protein